MYWELPSELVTQVEKMTPIATRNWDGRNAMKHWKATSHFWILIVDNIHSTQRIKFSPTHSSENPATSSNHLRCHLDIFSQTLHIIKTTLPSTLQPNSTQPNSTIYFFTYTLNSTSAISPKSEPSLKPLEAGNVPRLCVDDHTTQSVQPQGLTSWRKAGEKSK